MSKTKRIVLTITATQTYSAIVDATEDQIKAIEDSQAGVKWDTLNKYGDLEVDIHVEEISAPATENAIGNCLDFGQEG